MQKPSEVFSEMERRIKDDPEKTKNDINGTFKFNVSGDNGGSWFVDCKQVDVREGSEDDQADVVVDVTDEDLVAIADDQLDAMQAFMMGKLQVDGDMGLAMKLQEVI